MKFNAPKKVTWWIALIIGVVGIIAELVTIPVLTPIAFWLVAIGFVLLLLATCIKGLQLLAKGAGHISKVGPARDVTRAIAIKECTVERKKTI